MLISARDSVLLVIDIQERLTPAMQTPAKTIESTSLLLTAAGICEVPCLLSEQNPTGLGPTAPQITAAAGNSPIIEKMHFSCWKEADFRERFESLNRRQVIVTGMETHVCVLQTAASLIENDYEVFVVSDAVDSRTTQSKMSGLARLDSCGAQIVTTEMVIFEWLEKAGTPAFRNLLPHIKQMS